MSPTSPVPTADSHLYCTGRAEGNSQGRTLVRSKLISLIEASTFDEFYGSYCSTFYGRVTNDEAGIDQRALPVPVEDGSVRCFLLTSFVACVGVYSRPEEIRDASCIVSLTWTSPCEGIGRDFPSREPFCLSLTLPVPLGLKGAEVRRPFFLHLLSVLKRGTGDLLSYRLSLLAVHTRRNSTVLSLQKSLQKVVKLRRMLQKRPSRALRDNNFRIKVEVKCSEVRLVHFL